MVQAEAAGLGLQYTPAAEANCSLHILPFEAVSGVSLRE